MNKAFRSLLVALVVLCCLADGARAMPFRKLSEIIGQDEQYKVLRDLKAINIVIATHPQYVSSVDSVRSQFRKIMTDKLEDAGILVDADSRSLLRLVVTPVKDDDTGALTGSIRLSLELSEIVSLGRDPDRSFYAPTWTSRRDLTIDRLNSAAGAKYIEMQTMKFIAEYHRAQRR